MQDPPPASTTTKPVLEGHVFTRLQLFAMLPENLQEDAKQFRAYVEQDKSRLFQHHRHAFVKSVYGVKGKDLIDTIISWLHARYAPSPRVTPVPGLEPAWEIPNGTASSQQASANHAPAPGSALMEASHVTPEQLEAAKQVAEALVRLGFLTPYKEDNKHLTAMEPDHYVDDGELLIPVASSVADLPTTSVWSVVDDAIYARTMKRKAGLLGSFRSEGKGVYVVFNGRTKMAYLFESDLAREAISELSGPTLSVQFDNSLFEFGVRVTASTGGENEMQLFNAEFKGLQDTLVNAFLVIGAKFDEVGAGGATNTVAPLGFPSASHAPTENPTADASSVVKSSDQTAKAHAEPHVTP